MKRRLLPILMTLVLVCALPIWAAFVTSGDVTNPLVCTAGATELNLQGMIDRANAGDTIKLSSNTEVHATLQIKKDLTLDLNGHVLKMTGDVSVLKVYNGATLTITDSSAAKSGTITGGNAEDGDGGGVDADVAAAQTGDNGALHTGYVGQQLAGAAVDSLHIMQRRQEAALAGQLAHGPQQREASVLVGDVLISHRGHMAVQQTVCFGRVRIGMNVGKKDLVLLHPLEFLGKQLLHLIIDIGLSPHCIRVRDYRSGGLILRIGKTTAHSCSSLHIDRVAMACNFLHGGRHSGYPVFVFFDLLQNTDLHTNTPPKKLRDILVY